MHNSWCLRYRRTSYLSRKVVYWYTEFKESEATNRRSHCFRKKNKKLIALTIKPYLDTNNLKADIDKFLKTLSKLIDKFNLKEIEIIRDFDMMTQLQVFKFVESLNRVLEGKQVRATFYNDNLKIPPVEERYKLNKLYHCSIMEVQFGMTKTYHRIASKFYWRHMRQEICHFIRCYQNCQRTKVDRRKLHMPMIITNTSARAFDVISFDLHGKMKESKGYFWFLTIIDLWTKWLIAVPLQDSTAKRVTKALVENVITEYGCAKALLSDLGTQFQSKLMKAFADMFNIEHPSDDPR